MRNGPPGSRRLPWTADHVTQRGNGRGQTFFGDADYALYRDLLAEHTAAAGVEVWSWVLMPNHVHLVLVPSDADGIRRTMALVNVNPRWWKDIRVSRSVLE